MALQMDLMCQGARVQFACVLQWGWGDVLLARSFPRKASSRAGFPKSHEPERGSMHPLLSLKPLSIGVANMHHLRDSVLAASFGTRFDCTWAQLTKNRDPE